jgi:hypothetical protein
MRSLLPTRKMKPRESGYKVYTAPIVPDVADLDGDRWAVDIETNGLDATDPTYKVIGIGLSNNSGSFYFHLDGASDGVKAALGDVLRGSSLIAFNVFFDGAFLERDFGTLKWELDAYALYKQMSLEGWAGQSWGLESAQRDVLGWQKSNKAELDAALKAHDLTKSEMYKLPPEIIGRLAAFHEEIIHAPRQRETNYPELSEVLIQARGPLFPVALVEKILRPFKVVFFDTPIWKQVIAASFLVLLIWLNMR